jgi:glycosyltransferase involved in cell wall biosynthesis
MRLAVVHDFLNQMGGAERVVEEFHSLYPEAPVFTSIFDPKGLSPAFEGVKVRTSFMQHLPFVFSLFKWYLPFYPLAFESLKLKGFDVILSSSSAFAKGIRKPKGSIHICYCHTPAKFLWRFDLYAQREKFGFLIRNLLPLLLRRQRQWDLKNSEGVDYFIANSRNVAERIKCFYGRQAAVINPPVDTSLFVPSEGEGDFFLVVSRLNTYKRVDLVVEVFNALGLPLRIIGDGPDRKGLERRAKDNIEFLGRLPDRELARYYAACRALVFPGEEDFGLAPLEAMSAGRPVIAYARGGALETVIPGVTGLLFAEQKAESLAAAVTGFKRMSFDKEKIRNFARGFDREIFRKKIKDFVDEKAR